MREKVLEIGSFLKTLSATKKAEFKKLEKIEDSLAEKKKEKTVLEETLELLNNMTRLLIDRELRPIEEFVTYGLKQVFIDKDLSLRIDRVETPSGFKYDFIIKDGDIEAPVSDNFGGSVEEVVSLMLRLMVIHRLGKAKFLAMDEFFTGVDARHRPNLINLLKVLCNKAGFDIFLITHQEDFISGADTVLQAYPTLEGLQVREKNELKEGS